MDRRSFLSCGIAAAASAPFFSAKSLAEEWAVPSNQEKLQKLTDQALTRVAFGSCNEQTKDQSYWRLIAQDQPQLWIWLGDNIYADRANIDVRGQWYSAQKNNGFYKSFTDQVPVIGTWDDHDFFDGGADAGYAEKDASKQLMLDFLDVPADDPLRSRPGVFQNHVFGPVGKRTQLIMLDLRYFMERPKARRSLLGELQWKFLEDSIRENPADLLIIGSSLNVCSRITVAGLEGWHAFANERQRLYDLLASIDTPAILLSGDRHMGEIYRIVLGNGKPLYEVMSSGLTHAFGIKLPNKERQGEMVGKKNFGFLEIDWTSTGPQVKMQLRSTEKAAIYQNLAAQFSH